MLKLKPFKPVLFYCSNSILENKVIESLLSNDFIVKLFTDAKEMIASIKNAIYPHVILMDYYCNTIIDGELISKKIKKISNHIQIIPVLETDTVSFKQLYQECFFEPLIKPFTKEQVLLKISNACKQSSLLSNKESEFFITLTFANLEELRDKLTKDHNKRISLISYLIAKNLNCKNDCCITLKKAATLHDVGKHGIPESILNKPDILTPLEYQLIKEHTIMGYKILFPTFNLYLNTLLMASEIALKHHEKLDGSGYPNNLTSDSIPIYVRIVTMADIYDACTAKRSYHDTRSHEEGMEILYQEVKNKKLDKNIFQIFYKCSNEIEKIVRSYSHLKIQNENSTVPIYSLSATCLECFDRDIITKEKNKNG